MREGFAINACSASLIRLEPQRQGLQSAHERALGALGFSGQFDAVQPVEQGIDQDAHFQPRQVQAQALVRARAERGVAVGFARGVESVASRATAASRICFKVQYGDPKYQPTDTIANTATAAAIHFFCINPTPHFARK